MPNIVRIRDLISETNIDENILIPIDKDEYTDNARKISINDICEYCSTPTPPPGPYFTVLPSPQTIDSAGGTKTFTITFYNFVLTKYWLIPGLSARTWNSGSGTYIITTSLSGVGNSTFIVSTDALGPMDSYRTASIPVYASGITAPQIGVINQYPPGYNTPSFTSYKFNGSTIYDVGVGDTVTGVTASWSNTFPSNIQASSIFLEIGEGMSGNVTGLNPDGSTTLTFAGTGITWNVPHTTAVYHIEGLNTLGAVLDRDEPQIKWNYIIYWGSSPDAVLDEAGILGLQNNQLIIDDDILDEYDFDVPTTQKEYYYWCYPIGVDRIDFLENLAFPGTNIAVCTKNLPSGNYSTYKYTGTISGNELSYQSIVMTSSGWSNYRVYRTVNNFVGSAGTMRSYIRSVMV